MQGTPRGTDDPVLAHLYEAEAAYRMLRSEAEQQSAELHRLRAELAAARTDSSQLTEQLDNDRKALKAEHARAEQITSRSAKLAQMLKDVHRSLFDGNIYGQILRACLTITGATRGLYLTARGPDDKLRIRAAIDVDGYPKSPPSPFIQALCHKVLADDDSLVLSTGQERGDLPPPSTTAEDFRNCIATPVVLLKNLDGIVIVGDKLQGEFDEDDIETLLSVGDQAAVVVENVRLQRELQNAYLATVSMLADAVEAKDPYTHGHCEQVSRYARLTAQQLALSDHDRRVVCFAALLHDVGKIGVSDGVLNKAGPLLPEERELVRSHVRVGHDLIAKVGPLETVAEVVLYHHEWWDGTGYPKGLVGETIPLASRIVCVVDAYCAMITRRSYKEAYSDERARNELTRCAGTQFDPTVVNAFLTVLDLPAADDLDLDDDAECGAIPGFGHIRELSERID